jgi:asparagine synthase (glutamine-hydrolysing)
MMYMQLHHRFWRHFQRLPGALRGALAAAARSVAVTPRLDRVADILTRSAGGQELFWGASHAFWNIHKDRTLTPGAVDDCGGWPELSEAGLDMGGLAEADSGAVVGAMMEGLDARHPECDQLTRMIHSEFRIRLSELLLMRVDKITMANSIEGRVPFLDHRLVEFSMDIPMNWKIKGGEPKYLLKKALKGILPDDILYRPKMGFGAPMAQWLRGEFGKHAESTVLDSGLMERGLLNRGHIARMFKEHRSGKRDHELHLWILFNAAAWHDHWIGGR